MNKPILSIFFLCCCFISWAQQKSTIQIEGTIKGTTQGPIYLFLEDDFRNMYTISSPIQDGHFQFSLQASLPVLARLHIGQKSYLEDCYIDQSITSLICSNKIYIQAEKKDTMNGFHIDSIKGSNMETIKAAFFKKARIRNSIDIVNKDTAKYFKQLFTFVQENNNSKLAPYLIHQSAHLPYGRLDQLYKAIDTSLRNTFEMRNLESLIAKRQRQSMGLLDPGTPFHHITLPDTAGKFVNTDTLKGQCILIICWASWCKPCRDEIPELKQLKEKYGNKGLTMVNISFDHVKEKWLEALRKENMDWLQLIDTNRTSGELGKYYAIEFIPRLFLLDKDGKVIASGYLKDLTKKIRAAL